MAQLPPYPGEGGGLIVDAFEPGATMIVDPEEVADDLLDGVDDVDDRLVLEEVLGERVRPGAGGLDVAVDLGLFGHVGRRLPQPEPGPQQERLDERKDDLLKQWKIGELDKQAQEKWDQYSHYIEKMLKKTGFKKSPWIEVDTDDKKTARLTCIRHILNVYHGKEIYNIDEDLVKIHL